MKYITRTITRYVYVTGKVDLSKGTISETEEHIFYEPQRERKLANLVKMTGNPVISNYSEDAMYRMSVEDFISHSEIVTGETEEEEG